MADVLQEPSEAASLFSLDPPLGSQLGAVSSHNRKLASLCLSGGALSSLTTWSPST